MKVLVIAGGRSSEHDVSLESAKAVREGLKEQGHEVLYAEIAKDGKWTHQGKPVPLSPGAGLLGADVVFPVLHGPYGEDGTIQGLLEIVGVPYVGCGVHASAACMDKAVFKKLMAHHGIPQVPHVTLVHAPTDEDRAEIKRLKLPLFVKPSRLGSSVGISKVDTWDDLDAAVTEAFRHDSVVVVEQGSPGREIELGVLGIRDLVISKPGEIIVRKGDWYDYDAKYTEGGADVVIPTEVPEGQLKELRKTADRAFRLTGCSGMARVDFLVEPDRILISEINTIPGFTKFSAYPRLMETAGVPFGELLDRLLDIAKTEYRAANEREH